ncbi:MAG: DUF624 domain-containing protein [Clostridia bacterium]|nr:DUF624 domain-containing protein [Clostridia bacterium]
MGFFNYDKPGKGISKDAPRKKGIFLYFELLGRKFSKLMCVNMLYFLFSIPMMLLYFGVFLFVIPTALNIAFGTLDMWQSDALLSQMFLSLFMTLVCTITLGTGPASSSMAYVMREFSKEQHVWLWHNFIKKMKENLKKEIAICMIDLLFICFSTIAFAFYLHQYLSSGSLIWFILSFVIAFSSLVFALMHFYIHQLIVTFENKLVEIFKNAFLLTLSTLFSCVLLAGFIIGVNLYLNITIPALVIPLAFLVLISFFRFPVEFYVHSVIKKLIPIDENDTKTEEETIFSD